MITGKVWGTTERQIAMPLFEKHLLRIKPLHRCSLHRHHRKWNSFTVIQGVLFIDVVLPDRKIDTTKLCIGETTTVPPGVFHRFRTGDGPCVATEEYYPEALSEDIDRMDQGGPVVDGL